MAQSLGESTVVTVGRHGSVECVMSLSLSCQPAPIITQRLLHYESSVLALACHTSSYDLNEPIYINLFVFWLFTFLSFYMSYTFHISLASSMDLDSPPFPLSPQNPHLFSLPSYCSFSFLLYLLINHNNTPSGSVQIPQNMSVR